MSSIEHEPLPCGMQWGIGRLARAPISSRRAGRGDRLVQALRTAAAAARGAKHGSRSGGPLRRRRRRPIGVPHVFPTSKNRPLRLARGRRTMAFAPGDFAEQNPVLGHAPSGSQTQCLRDGRCRSPRDVANCRIRAQAMWRSNRCNWSFTKSSADCPRRSGRSFCSESTVARSKTSPRRPSDRSGRSSECCRLFVSVCERSSMNRPTTATAASR